MACSNASRMKMVATGRTTGHGRPIYDGINQNGYSDLFLTLCLTGMRIGEAIHLTWSDVDFNNKVILIRPGMKNGGFWQPKTKHGIRRIAIVPELAAVLHRLKKTTARTTGSSSHIAARSSTLATCKNGSAKSATGWNSRSDSRFIRCVSTGHPRLLSRGCLGR